MSDERFLQELSGQLSRNFDLEAPGLDFEELERVLAQKILGLLRGDHTRLFQILYRIDISEKEVDRSFNLGEIHQVAKDLAQKIIDRQLQKLKTRRQY